MKELYTVRQVGLALQKCGGIRNRAAQMLGCARQTIGDYIDRHPELAEIEIEAVEARLDFAEDKLMQNIERGKEPSVFFFLKCKGKRRGYVERTEHTGPGGKPMEISHEIDLSQLNKEERDAIRKLLERRVEESEDGSQ